MDNIAIWDGHIHMNDTGGPLLPMLEGKRNAYQQAGYESVCLVCDTSAGIHGIPKNLMALLYKWLFPEDRIYVMAGLDYFLPGETIAPHTFRNQAKALVAAGADGFKMYEGKPNARKQIGNRSLLDESYGSFFSWLEEAAVPVAVHLADPDNFWDPTACNAATFQNGWFFGDSSFASAEQIRAEVIEVLDRYPDLKMVIPQLGFITHRLDDLARWLERYPKLMYDLGPTPEFYRDLAHPGGELKHFLRQYAHRIFFSCTGVCPTPEAVVQKAKKHIGILQEALADDPDAQKAVFSGSFHALCGQPRKVDQALCLELADRILTCLTRCPEEVEPYRSARLRTEEIQTLFHSITDRKGGFVP